MSIFDRIQKRKARPVEVSGGSLWIRDLTFREIETIQASEHRDGLTLALALVNEDGSPMLPRNADEDEAAWSARMVEEVKDLSPDDMAAITEAVMKSLKVPALETLAKKPDGTPS